MLDKEEHNENWDRIARKIVSPEHKVSTDFSSIKINISIALGNSSVLDKGKINIFWTASLNLNQLSNNYKRHEVQHLSLNWTSAFLIDPSVALGYANDSL